MPEEQSKLNWKRIEAETTSASGTKSVFVPKEGQHHNALSESMVKLTKRSQLISMGQAHLGFTEFQLACAEAANTINNRPIGVLPGTTDDMLEPLTPNHLLLGRSSRLRAQDEDLGEA